MTGNKQRAALYFRLGRFRVRAQASVKGEQKSCAPPGTRVWVTVAVTLNARYLTVILPVGSDTHRQADNPLLVLSEVF